MKFISLLKQDQLAFYDHFWRWSLPRGSLPLHQFHFVLHILTAILSEEICIAQSGSTITWFNIAYSTRADLEWGTRGAHPPKIFSNTVFQIQFLAATKQLYKWYFPSVCPSVRLSVCPSVRLSHLFDYVPIIVSSWNCQELLPMTKVRSMQKVKVRGQRSRSERSQPNLAVSGL